MESDSHFSSLNTLMTYIYIYIYVYFPSSFWQVPPLCFPRPAGLSGGRHLSRSRRQRHWWRWWGSMKDKFDLGYCHEFFLNVCFITGRRLQRASPRSQKRPIGVFEEALTGKTQNVCRVNQRILWNINGIMQARILRRHWLQMVYL